MKEDRAEEDRIARKKIVARGREENLAKEGKIARKNFAWSKIRRRQKFEIRQDRAEEDKIARKTRSHGRRQSCGREKSRERGKDRAVEFRAVKDQKKTKSREID